MLEHWVQHTFEEIHSSLNRYYAWLSNGQPARELTEEELATQYFSHCSVAEFNARTHGASLSCSTFWRVV